MFLLSSVHPLNWQTLQFAVSQEAIVRDAPIDGSACTGEMNQFSVSGHTADRKCALGAAWGPHWCYTMFISRLLLSPPPYTHIHTHRRAQVRAQSLIASGLSSSVASLAPRGPLLLWWSKAGWPPSIYSVPHAPLFTPSQDKFNLEVQRTDKTRRQHKGQRGREVIWYLLQPPFTSYTQAHTYTHTSSSPFPPPYTPTTPCIPRQRHLFFPLCHFFCYQMGDRRKTEERRMSNTVLLISDTLPVELYQWWMITCHT